MLKVPARLATLQGINSYSDDAHAGKLAFHRDGPAFLRALATAIGMPTGSYTVRTNKGGIAVSGEVTLHGETLYVWMEESCVGRRGITITYRTCRGLTDYSGGRNNSVMLADLRNAEVCRTFIEHCKLLGGFTA